MDLYVPFEVAVDAVASVMRNGHHDDGSDCDDAVRNDARTEVLAAFLRAAAAEGKDQSHA